jgi:hypothetical protein
MRQKDIRHWDKKLPLGLGDRVGKGPKMATEVGTICLLHRCGNFLAEGVLVRSVSGLPPAPFAAFAVREKCKAGAFIFPHRGPRSEPEPEGLKGGKPAGETETVFASIPSQK